MGANDCAFFFCKISTSNISPTHCKPISMGKVEKYLSTECKVSSDSVLWLHISNAMIIKKVTEHFHLGEAVTKSFLDSTPMWRLQQFNDATHGPAFLANAITAQIIDESLNVRKLHCYVAPGLVLTFENRVHATSEDGSEPQEKSSVPSPLMKGISISSTSDFNLNSTNSTSLATGYALNGTSVVAGEFFDGLLNKVNDETVHVRIIQKGSVEVFFEALQVYFQIFMPTLRYYCQEMLTLHDKVFVRKHKPSYYEGLQLNEDIDNFRCCYKLLFNVVFAQSQKFQEKLLALCKTNFPNCEIALCDFDYEHIRIYSKLEQLQAELNRIDENLMDLIHRRNDRVNLMLSIAATTFLPLSFLTGKFCLENVNFMLETK